MAVGTVSGVDPVDNWQLIASGTPTSASSTYSFTSISGYKTLMIAFKKVGTNAVNNLIVRFNGDSTDRNYNSIANGYDVTGQYSTTGIALTGYLDTSHSGYTVINNASSTTIFKTVQEGAAYVTNTYGGIWLNNTDAISSAVISTTTSTFNGTGTFYLYGIAA
jgi:hypothetical protein